GVHAVHATIERAVDRLDGLVILDRAVAIAGHRPAPKPHGGHGETGAAERAVAHGGSYFSATTELRSVPMPLISTSITSPGTMSPSAPSVPIQSTSPGCNVAVLLISWIQVAVSQI